MEKSIKVRNVSKSIHGDLSINHAKEYVSKVKKLVK